MFSSFFGTFLLMAAFLALVVFLVMAPGSGLLGVLVLEIDEAHVREPFEIPIRDDHGEAVSNALLLLARQPRPRLACRHDVWQPQTDAPSRSQLANISFFGYFLDEICASVSRKKFLRQK